MNFLVAWSMRSAGSRAAPAKASFLFGVRFLLLVLLGLFLIQASQVLAAPVSNIRMTKHNLSKDSGNTVRAAAAPVAGQVTTDQICVFCHTPHASSSTVKSPLWNRDLKAATTYTGYTSLSMDADAGGFKTDTTKGRPAGASLLCLSCHDGTIALGNVNVLEAKTPVVIDMTGGDASDMMPIGSGVDTGYTRRIGANLSNDHPISVTYNKDLADTDKELRKMNDSQQHPDTGSIGSIIGIRSPGYRPLLPLAPTGAGGAGQVQCSTCHDPHLYDAADPNRKFLRANRLQVNPPAGGAFNEANDIICLGCHDKMQTEWSNSVHANSTTANYAYTGAATTQRQFTAGTTVWKAACLNCHDTHTVSGARRLLREGTTGTGTPKSGGKSAIEETCYQCHTAFNATTPPNVLTQSATLAADTGVPDIKTEFGRAIRMPIIDTNQGGPGGNSTEVHDISDGDFTESRENLGLLDTKKRHVECTDCHNPHRVTRNTKIDGTGVTTQRTHVAGGTAGSYTVETDGNVASGVLRGTWGVEPVDAALTGTVWPEPPTSYTVKKGVTGAGTARSSAWLTREYQLCFKCHSSYSNTDGSFPAVGHTGGTPYETNGLQKYTNVAAEFAVNAADPPATNTDQGEKGEGTAGTEDGYAIEPNGSYPGNVGNSDTNASVGVNHRSWHPVRWPTGRSRDERRMQATGGNFRTPFGSRVGTQTMYCSDCHGNAASWSVDSGPLLTQVQGPHGSTNNFLLKGTWSSSTSIGSPGFCGNCHNPSAGTSGTGDTAARVSGFNAASTDDGGGHGNAHGGKSCMKCHVAVPHGWKNKAFLVNLNCVGSEAGAAYSGCQSFSSGTATVAPYYQGATLRVRTWAPSGNWGSGNCGRGSGSGRDWMRSVCDN